MIHAIHKTEHFLMNIIIIMFREQIV